MKYHDLQCDIILMCRHIFSFYNPLPCMNVDMHACMHACMYVCMYVCMYLYMYWLCITRLFRFTFRSNYLPQTNCNS